jgi:hypothetical protein
MQRYTFRGIMNLNTEGGDEEGNATLLQGGGENI